MFPLIYAHFSRFFHKNDVEATVKILDYRLRIQVVMSLSTSGAMVCSIFP